MPLDVLSPLSQVFWRVKVSCAGGSRSAALDNSRSQEPSRTKGEEVGRKGWATEWKRMWATATWRRRAREASAPLGFGVSVLCAPRSSEKSPRHFRAGE